MILATIFLALVSIFFFYRFKEIEYGNFSFPLKPLLDVRNIFTILVAVAVCIHGQTGNLKIDLASTIVFFVLLAITIFDRAYSIIPDRLQIIGAVAAIYWTIQSYCIEGIISHLATSLVVVTCLLILGFVYRKFRRKDAMGLGDVKLIAWTSLLLGPFTLMALSLAILLQTVFVFFSRNKDFARGKAFPFAPALCCAISFFFYLMNQF